MIKVISNNYDINHYCAQVGDNIQFKYCENVKWYIDKKYVGKGRSFLYKNASQGTLNIKCKLSNGKYIKKSILIYPKIDCRIFINKHLPIHNNTKELVLDAHVLCAEVVSEKISQESQENFSILMEKISNTYIKNYGKHILSAQPFLKTEINSIYKNGRYPPITKDIYILPENLSLRIHKKDKRVKMSINNLSQDMFKGEIIWYIDNKQIKTYEKKLCYFFTNRGKYCVKIWINIPECPPITLFENIEI